MTTRTKPLHGDELVCQPCKMKLLQQMFVKFMQE